MRFDDLANITHIVPGRAGAVVGHHDHRAIWRAAGMEEDATLWLRCGNGRFEERRDSRTEALLEAAMTATQPEGRILLHASGTPERAMVVVSDNGPGTTEDDMREVRQIVEAHGGIYTRMAEAGQGTATKIELPR